jgi:hypothetical protein
MDRYLAGEEVALSQLRLVWSECVGGWFSRTFESPVYAEFFETVRSARLARGSERPRVLLGDPPFDPLDGVAAVELALDVTSTSPGSSRARSSPMVTERCWWLAAGPHPTL